MAVAPDTGPVTWQPDELLALALSTPSEARAAARQVLAQNPTAAQAAVAHQAAGVVLRHFGDIDDAIGELENARRFARRAGELDRESDIRASLGVAPLLAGQTQRGLSVLDALGRDNSRCPAGRILLPESSSFWV